MNFNNFSKRMNINAIREFLMFGDGNVTENEPKNYQERLSAANDEIDALFEELVSDEEKRETFLNHIFVSISKIEDVYFEMGLLSGAKISAQMQEKLTEMNLGA